MESACLKKWLTHQWRANNTNFLTKHFIFTDHVTLKSLVYFVWCVSARDTKLEWTDRQTD